MTSSKQYGEGKMYKLLTSILLVFVSTASVSADALHRNPDQPSGSANMQTFGRTSIPIGAYEYCKRYAMRCQYESKASGIQLTRNVWAKVVDTNISINSVIRPMTDKEIFGVEERWELPVNVGDCEDYVLAKKQELSRIGIPPGALRVTVVYDANDGGHAVLTLVTDKGDFILDNNNNKVLRWQEAELTYLKRQKPGNLLLWESLRPNG